MWQATKKYKHLAKDAVECQQVESGPWEDVAVDVTFYHKTERRRDDINHMHMLKPAFDGIVDAGLVVDDNNKNWKSGTPLFKKDKDCPRVEITIKRLT